MHTEAAPTTAETSRRPLLAVIALPRVLSAARPTVALPPGGSDATDRITATVYNDEGEELEVGAACAWFCQWEPSGHAGAGRRREHPPACLLTHGTMQVGTSPCHFITLEATITHQPNGGEHAAEVLLRFGSPEHLACEGAAAAAGGDDASPPPVAWPALAGVSVLGWYLPVQGARVEVVQQAEPCGELLVVGERAAVPAAAVGAAGLRLDLSSLDLQLACPLGLRISWSSSSSSISGVQTA